MTVSYAHILALPECKRDEGVCTESFTKRSAANGPCILGGLAFSMLTEATALHVRPF